ncbi:hypothetical protein OPKNFCMD_3323 [Methylobacterium crusticola]|uniref:Lytic murein transglycosylase n=1 Tax=Methylobacterium crusticola TaxID=1697972 RepID=A0ABQ4QYU2_9HYPH|nr:hypothetical protein [Methylobacterium crusticola]GJD50580.1 hypothetical protein OPKNFCMD_3323 [Methylobacterium crusticola]
MSRRLAIALALLAATAGPAAAQDGRVPAADAAPAPAQASGAPFLPALARAVRAFVDGAPPRLDDAPDRRMAVLKAWLARHDAALAQDR